MVGTILERMGCGVVTVGRNSDVIDELNCVFNAGREFDNNSFFGPSHVDFENEI